MKRLIAFFAIMLMGASAGYAQPGPQYERDAVKQRAALDHWTRCLAAEQEDRVRAVLLVDYREDDYKSELSKLARTRVSETCFESIPRRYRKMRLGGLPFAGALAEQIIAEGDESLLMRLSKAALTPDVQTFSYTDKAAVCTVKGAPHLVAQLFGTQAETEAETAALSALKPVTDYCTASGAKIEASALAMRSMLATASYRVLAAAETNKAMSLESEPNA